ncbi:MAG: DNA-directed RNA polymerase subunit A' [Candidatus Marsarchaeota archaeon]|nr:DNA-directed RNA polymerase subunit A' [Candidatus Marsarchaeota archaeon]
MSTAIYKTVRGLRFELMSPDLIRKISVMEVKTEDLYDRDGLPVKDGLMDRRMGTLEPNQRCQVCGGLWSQCPGHFGHVELAKPVYHVGHMKKIVEVLKATCHQCHRLMIPEDQVAELYARFERLELRRPEQARAFVKKVCARAAGSRTGEKALPSCPHCGAQRRKIRLEKPVTVVEEKEEGDVKIYPDQVQMDLALISDKRDVKLLGMDPDYARPEWMVLTALPIPPLVVRPSIILESGDRSEDDLTHKLVDIVRTNKKLNECVVNGSARIVIEHWWDLLQFHVATFFDNEIAGYPPAKHRSGRPLRTIAQRLKGKDGLFRGGLSGKRVDFSARTVISPDPNLSINEVGVPEQVALILTIPERVTPSNIEALRVAVKAGADSLEGANYIIRPDGRRIDLSRVKEREELAQGLDVNYIVERHIRNGDVVLFNRQPSLHRMSIMAHRVKILPGRTFRMTPPVCPPYNADFDGDEMNLHVPQNDEARAEALVMMLVQEQILSPRFGGPIIGGQQDYITGAYLLTRRTTYLEKQQVEQILAASGLTVKELPPPVVTKPNRLWSGKQVFSLFLPKGLNYVGRANFTHSDCKLEKCELDDYVLIRDGVLVSGVIDKKSVGQSQPGSLLHRLVKDYGEEAAKDFIDRAFKAFAYYFDHYGFTMTFDDVSLPDSMNAEIESIVEEYERKVKKLNDAYKAGELEALPGKSLEDTLEQKVMQVLTEARDRVGALAAEKLNSDSGALIMAKTGSRGNMLNLTQMAAIIGQVSVRGKRINKGYSSRALPHFEPGDRGAEAGGFVTSSFSRGLKPTEFFFHAAGGREGLVDTAVRTSQSGYMQRKLINALQDLRVDYDSTVRTPGGLIIQYRYGEDGVDPSRSDSGRSVNVEKVIEKVVASE